MPLQLRTFDTILADMIAHVRANTTLTDFSIGSAIRTILEAAALEDDEQYHQMAQTLDDFRYTTATGADLDARAADFNLTRLPAAQATTQVIYRDGGLTQTSVKFDLAATGVTSLEVDDSSEFPVPGASYTVRIGEGTANVEDVTVTANSTSTNTFTVSATTKIHNSGERVAHVTGSDVDIASGTQVQVPAQGDSAAIIYEVVEKATLIAGNYESTVAQALATVAGSSSNAPAGQISQFVASPPFTGGSVSNTTAAEGGRDRETDVEFRKRIRAHLNSLGKGVGRAIESGVKGVTDTATGQYVVSANLVEDFTTNEHLLYIDDGTGFTPSSVTFARSTLASGVGIGVGTLTLVSAGSFPSSGYILVSPADHTQAELIEYTSKTATVLTSATNTTKTHDLGDEVILVDKLPLAEEGQNFFQVTNYPSQRNSYEIYSNASGSYRIQTEGTDYFYNRTNGDLQFYGNGLPEDAQVLINHTYYTGLFALAQKVVSGDKFDPVNYPGIAAAGVTIYLDTATIREITMTISISVETGYDEDEIKGYARIVAETYITGRLMGENVILAKISERIMSIRGVEDVKFIYPTDNIVILENELPRPYNTAGSSLITVL